MSLKKLSTGKYQVRYRDEHRKQRARNFKNKEQAQHFLRKLDRGEVRTGAEMLFGDYADRWLRDYCRLEKAPSQHVTNETIIRVHLKPALAEFQLGELTRARLEEFRRALREKNHPKSGKPLSTKTVNLILSQLRRMMTVAVDWELLPTNPAAGVKLFRQAQQPFSFWSASERDFFLRFARQHDPRLTELVTVAVHTGLRLGEIAALERRQLDFERGMIQVDASYCFASKRRLERTKSGRIGYVPMRDEVREVLQARKLLAPSSQIFPLDAFRHTSQRLRALCKKVGVRPIRFHDLRHTFASDLVANGVPLYTVQRLLRHESSAMTQRYAHLSPDDLRTAMGVVHKSGTGDATVTSNLRNIGEIYGAVGRI